MVVILKHTRVLPKNTLFQKHYWLHCHSQFGNGGPRCRSTHSEELWVVPVYSPNFSLLALHVCCSLHNVCVDCANSVEVYAHQITPLKRQWVGKESPAKRWCLEACCLLTCNASRSPAGCGGPCFIFYKGCCSLQHVPSVQAGVTSCSHVLLEMASHLLPAHHQPKTCWSWCWSCCNPWGDPANCQVNLLCRIYTEANGLFYSAN